MHGLSCWHICRLQRQCCVERMCGMLARDVFECHGCICLLCVQRRQVLQQSGIDVVRGLQDLSQTCDITRYVPARECKRHDVQLQRPVLWGRAGVQSVQDLRSERQCHRVRASLLGRQHVRHCRMHMQGRLLRRRDSVRCVSVSGWSKRVPVQRWILRVRYALQSLQDL